MSTEPDDARVEKYWPVHWYPFDGWMACEQPERPLKVGLVGFHPNCHGCRVALDAVLRQPPDTGSFIWERAAKWLATRDV